MKLNKIFVAILSFTLLVNACKTDSTNNAETSETPSVKADSLLKIVDAEEKKLYEKRVNKPNLDLGLNVVKAYTDFINAFPEDKRVPEFLFKAGEVCSAINASDGAIEYFERLYTEFPKNDKAIFAMFLHAFVLENQTKDLTKAKAKYEEVIKTYPGTQQALDAKASIEHLGKSPEDLIKEFEARNGK